MPDYKITLVINDHDLGIAASRILFNDDTGEVLVGLKSFQIEEIK